MTTTGDNVVAAMLDAWRAVHPIRRASIRWRCDVRLYRAGRATAIAHRPTEYVTLPSTPTSGR